MTEQNTIRRRADGSIDVDFFAQKGRVERSQNAHRLANAITHGGSKAIALVAAFLVIGLSQGGQS